MLTENLILCGDAEAVLATLPAESVNLTVTSPPYYRHRDYRVSGQIGREKTLDAYLARIRGVLTQLLRATAKTGACFFVVGDTYDKQRLLLVPHRIALAAGEIGWTVLCTIASGAVMVTGYFLYEQLILGYAAVAEVPINAGQVLVGIAVALPAYKSLKAIKRNK